RAPLPAGLAALVLLLILALVGTAALTIYLLRTTTEQAAPPSSIPAPYRVLFRQGGALDVEGVGVAPRRLTALPAGIAASAADFHLAPSGGEALLISEVGGFHGWILAAPDGQPLPLPGPPTSVGKGPWRFVSIAWKNGRIPSLLLAAGDSRAPHAVVGRFTLDPKGRVSAAWTPLGVLDGQPLSLSPKATAIALLEARPASGDFEAQYVVRLQRLDGSRPRVSWRGVGAQPPTAILWAPDGGTLVVVNQGLAIQKSSGRAVRHVKDGALPISFSPNGDSLAYLSGVPGAWQIHVLRLHGEYDHPFASPDQASPRWLGWTPDGRALVYLTGTALWQIEPDSGVAIRVADSISGVVAGIARAGTPFTR
ncbi:MAG: TolB family protein, partial [Chloroflexota bacterium]